MKRRRFVQLACMSGLIPLIELTGNKAIAAPDNEVSADDPLAVQLAYVPDAKQAAGHPKYREGSDCANCMFFKPELNDGCVLFGNRRVRKEGWCKSWVAAPK